MAATDRERDERHRADDLASDVAVEPDHDEAQDRDVAARGARAAIDDEVAPSQGVEATAEADADAAATADVADADRGKMLTLGGYGHVWIKGDTPWKVAKHYYGEGREWRRIKAANADKWSRLREGMVLDIPPIEVAALTAFLRFKDQPRDLRGLVTLMPHADYEAFFTHLTPAQIDKHGEFLQVLELMRATGKTVAELAADQRAFLQDKAKAEGTDVGESVGAVVKEKGYGGAKATFWDSRNGEQRKEWKRRFDAVVKSVKAAAPEDVKAIITDAEKKGGGFRWSPREVEQSHAFAYTYDGSWELHCGVRWVEAAEADPASVHGNIAHEMGGHNYYGDNELGYAIQKGAMTADEEKTAEKSGNSLYSTYGYMETEIFAELYEFPYNFPSTKDRTYPSDTAFDTDRDGNDVTGGNFDNRGDVVRLLKRIQDAFAPNIASGLVASLERRVQLDPRIVPMAKERFREAVRNVFVAPP